MIRQTRTRGSGPASAPAFRASVAASLAIVVVLLGLAPVSAGAGQWTQVGLKGRDLSVVAVSPTNPKIIIAGGTQRDEADKAYDAQSGQAWSNPTGLNLYRSLDSGRTWKDIRPKIKFAGGAANPAVEFVEFDPKDPNIVYANFTSGGAEGTPNKGTGLYRSADGGKTWRLVFEAQVHSIAVSPEDPSIVYATAENRGVKQGSWGDGLGDVTTGPELARSSDRGLTWKTMAEVNWSSLVAVSPMNPNAIAVSWDDTVSWGQSVPADQLVTVRLSEDGGRSWTNVRSEYSVRTGYFGLGHLAFDRSGSVLYATHLGGCDQSGRGCGAAILRGVDRGRRWEAAYSRDNVTFNYAFLSVLPDPLDSSVVYAIANYPPSDNVAEGANGVALRSADRGSSFAQLGSPVYGTGLSALAVDRANPQTLYAATDDGVWAYTFDKTAAQSAATATATSAPAPTATVAALATPTPAATAMSAATPTPAPSPTDFPTPTAPPIAAVAPTVVATTTPDATPTPQEESAFGPAPLLVGGGAVALLVVGVVGRRLTRRLP